MSVPPETDPVAGEHSNATAYLRTADAFRARDSPPWELCSIREHDVLASDEHVVALRYMGVRRPDLELETRVVSVFHFRGGRQVERWFYPQDATVWDRIFELPGEAAG